MLTCLLRHALPIWMYTEADYGNSQGFQRANCFQVCVIPLGEISSKYTALSLLCLWLGQPLQLMVLLNIA